MAVLQKGNSQHLFWGDTINLITGLDPLGLQVTSEATYALMLPGISNLTNRIRYFGFYCWLLDFYFKKEKKGSQLEQYRFIRRAELLVAIIMQNENSKVTQITGSDFASNLLIDKNRTEFDLAAGADKDSGNEKLYWKYPSGAFGQYYFGAMQALSLAIRYHNQEGDIIFNITQPHLRQTVSGKDLADAYNENLTDEVKELFYNCLKRGKLLIYDIPVLYKYFSIDKVNPKTVEWELYVGMLLDKDFPGKEIEEEFTFHRRNSIISLVRSSLKNNNKYNWNNYLDECYKQKYTTADSTNIGWYCYQINEYWQFACGLIFWSTLNQLELLHRDQYLPKFINDFAVKIMKEIEAGNNISLGKYLSEMDSDKLEDELIDEITTNNAPEKNAKIGFEILFQLYKNNKEELPQLKEYLARNGIIRDGNMADGLMNVHCCLETNLSEFISSFLHRHIIFRHQMVALRKLGNGTQATYKFMIEEMKIRLIDNFPPRWTSPRMNALKNLLFDLQIIDDKEEITKLHLKLIHRG